MEFVATIIGVVLIAGSIQDAFEVVLLPRRVQRRLRLMRYFFRATWAAWSGLGARLPSGPKRENFLGVYGPLSMVLLFSLWAVCLIVGFGLLQWALPTRAGTSSKAAFASSMFLSGEAFFTLGYGDVPQSRTARILVIIESGTGFGFVALTISYLPVLYSHFSRRDMQLIQLDARAGSPPTAQALLHRYATDGRLDRIDDWLHEWELWAAELIESHSSYPMLSFYRSQHENQSWLASLAVTLDSCALLIGGVEGIPFLQAGATFAVARRVLVEMSRSLDIAPARLGAVQRLSPQAFTRLERALAALGPRWKGGRDAEERIAGLRATYEPLLAGLSSYLLLPLPDWLTDGMLPDCECGREDLARRLSRNAIEPGELM